MAEHPNLESARAGYAAFATGDMAAVGDLLADDIVWHSGGSNILTGDYEGKEAVFNYFARLMQETGGTFKNEIHDMLANDEHGVALVTFSAARGGKSLEGSIVHVFHMRDGKMTEFWSISEDQAQFDEFWA
jgi:ketosteroid isomerase-like protein